MQKLLLIFILFITNNGFAQSGKWTWMNGSVASNFPNSSYGTLGIAANTNEPPARYQCAYWTDLNGIFWVFGGVGGGGLLNDLWKFDPTTNLWTWVNGPQIQDDVNGTYGAIGVPSVNNCPSARGYGANCWTDSKNYLWLYGGSNTAANGGDDLWRYNTATNEWTLMKGNTTNNAVSAGIRGIPNATNSPGYLQETKSGYVDNNDNLWMIGNSSELMWKYNPSINQWTWMKGSLNNSSANYGTMGVESDTNQPIGRCSYTKWKDINGNFYIFAGLNSFASLNPETYNDVWKFNPNTNNWTWISGSNTPNQNSLPPAACTKTLLNFPNTRLENQTASTVGCTNAFWSFGGFENTTGLTKCYGDLWLFDVATNEWTFVNGDVNGTNYSYGTKGVYAPSNQIPGKGGVGIWIDKKNNLWVFGGFCNINGNLNFTNDMWKFEPDTNCFTAKLNGTFTLPSILDSTICKGDKIVYNIGLSNNISILPSNTVTYTADSTIVHFAPSTTTTYTIIATSTSLCPGTDTMVKTIEVLNPPIPIITAASYLIQKDSTTTLSAITSVNAVKYEWYFNGQIVSTQLNYTPPVFTKLGFYCYKLVAYNALGCSDTTTACLEVESYIKAWIPNTFTPNGDNVNDILTAVTRGLTTCDFKIYNRYGEIAWQTTNPLQGWNGDYNYYPADMGTYFYTFTYLDFDGTKKVLQGDIALYR